MDGISSSDETPDEEEVERNFEAEAKLIVESHTLPKKSVDKYNLVYATYQQWKQKNKNSLSKSEESNLVVYFKELSTKLRPSTLWSIYSMLKKTLNTKDDIDVGEFHKLKSLIKNNAKGYKPKKSSVLTWDEVTEFISNAPDDTYLASKVILIFGICGAMRCEEIKELKVNDVEDLGGKYLISIDETKNDLPRKFVIGNLFYKKVKQYISLKPTDFYTTRFFIQYHKGKCERQVIGRNTIGLIPRNIASYLKLKDPHRYTGHCFRRTSATLLSNSGANATMLKQLGGWKSTGIAEGYVENSLKNRQKIFDNITHAATSNGQWNPQPSTSVNSATGVMNIDKNEEPTEVGVDDFNFSDDFEVDGEVLAEIEKSVASEVPKSASSKIPKSTQSELSKSPIPFFTTGNNKRIILGPNRQSTKPTHFMTKPPISIFSREKENEPPMKKMKSERAGTGNNETSEPSIIHSISGNNPSISYHNCVFHATIINNFYPKDLDDGKKK